MAVVSSHRAIVEVAVVVYGVVVICRDVVVVVVGPCGSHVVKTSSLVLTLVCSRLLHDKELSQAAKRMLIGLLD